MSLEFYLFVTFQCKNKQLRNDNQHLNHGLKLNSAFHGTQSALQKPLLIHTTPYLCSLKIRHDTLQYSGSATHTNHKWIFKLEIKTNPKSWQVVSEDKRHLHQLHSVFHPPAQMTPKQWIQTITWLLASFSSDPKTLVRLSSHAIPTRLH